MRRLLLPLALLALASCSSAPQTAVPGKGADAAWLRGQLAELQALPCPAGCSGAAWGQLKGALASSIEHRLAGKGASAPPTATKAAPQLKLDPNQKLFTWYHVLPGDYDQNGEVNISDLTPLGVHFSQSSGGGPFPATSIESVVDGDGNGEINISDITPLGAALGSSITEWRLYGSAVPGDYPAEAGAPSTVVPMATRAVANDDTSDPQTFRRVYRLNLAGFDPAFSYWVRGGDAQGDGIPSPMLDGANQHPIVSLVPSITSGPAPLTVDFDASGTTDPEGDAFTFFWRFSDEAAGAIGTGLNQHTFTSDGIYEAYLTAEDEHGASRSLSTVITVTSSAQWRDVVVDSSHELNCINDFDLEYVSKRPLIAYSYADTGLQGEVVTVATVNELNDIGTPDWPTAQVQFSALHLCALDLANINGGPALTYVAGLQNGNLEVRYAQRTVPGDPTSWGVYPVTELAGIPTFDDVEPQLMQAGDRPAVAYHGVGGALMYQPATDTALSGWDAAQVLDGAADNGESASVGYIAGSPALAYWVDASDEMRYIDSSLLGNVVTWNAPITSNPETLGRLNDAVIQLADGSPGIGYLDATAGKLMFARAADPLGDSFPTLITILTLPGGNLAAEPSFAVIGGTPSLVYNDPYDDDKLKFIAADTADGMGWGTPEELAPHMQHGPFCVLKDIEGYPAVAYVDENYHLHLVIKY